MRVLHILSELRPSGFEVMLKVSAPYWRKMGIHAEILATGETVGRYAPFLEREGYPIYHLPFYRSYLRAFAFFILLFRFLRVHRYDALHIHVESANMWITLVAKLAGVPYQIRTIHSVFPWKGWLGLKRRLQRRISRSVGVTHVSIGPSVKATEWNYFQNPTIYIANWFDNKGFVPLGPELRDEIRTNLDIDDDTFVVVSVGNCSHCKNHAAILKSLADISKEINFLYFHVGEEEAGQPERYLAEELGIAKQVRFLGFVKDVYPILNASDVYVMPSLHEGIGIAAIEAMGAGIPVVLADVPGLRDFKNIADEVIWVDPDAVSLSKALLELASIPKDLRSKIGLSLHHAANRRFSVEQGVNAYAALYKSHNKGNGRGHELGIA